MRGFPRLFCALGLLVGSAGADEMCYVIKVTPALVYVDAGAPSGVELGDTYLVLRPTGDEAEPHAQVGEVRIIRVSEAFSIAEILSVAEGEELAVLQRAIPERAWDAMGAAAELEERELALWEEQLVAEAGSRFIYLLGGGDLGKGTVLLPGGGAEVTGFDRAAELGAGIRVGNHLGRKWRLSLTYRVSGRQLEVGDGDVTQASFEVDLHYLWRGRGATSPYLGLGAGMHQLTWDANEPLPDSATKPGINAVGGVGILLGEGNWGLLFEVGYQWVKDWNGVIDASNTRAYVGFGRNL